ncbi:MAG: 3-carboxy-cis,cis-muconate cycloisomerase [Actinobacteria bacterium]|nr:MAG: 3-carboxy-cis,cis-muconate cycloisomerase [Actinomycetota bacterium]
MDTALTSGSRDPKRLSSSTSDGVFAGIYARGPAAAAVSGEAWFQAMLDVEAALARACAREAMISRDAADTIAAACVAGHFDLQAIVRETAGHASPVVPLVHALREHVGEELAPQVHLGATSQDILDTAAMLVSSRTLVPVLDDAQAAARSMATLADRHRRTPMSGRTLLQQAVPVSFGLRAAGWLVGIAESRARLVEVRERELAVQMGGPVGARAPAVASAVAADLGLAEPVLPWHTIRVRMAALASALAALAGVLAKIARDVTLLAQNEVGEVREGGGRQRGGSTAMGHKRNPVAAVSVLACTRRVPGLVATILSSMEQEHERAAGAWQAEWDTLSDLLTLTGSAASWGRDLLDHLEVDAGRMRENLGRLARAGVSDAGDPERHLGAASQLIDRALAAVELDIPEEA